MPVLITRQAVLVNATTPRVQTAPMVIDPLTATIEARLQRPTTAAPRAWTATGRCTLTIVLTADGVEHRYSAERRGGVRVRSRDTTESSESVLRVAPTYGFGATRDTQMKRLGQRATVYTVHVVIDRIAGSVNTALDLVTTEASVPLVAALTDAITATSPGPGEFLAISNGTREFGNAGTGWIGSTEQFTWTERTATHLRIGVRGVRGMPAAAHAAGEVVWHSSVAFQAATDAQDETGDAVITIPHTATGTDLAAFAGSGNGGAAGLLGATTYDGSAMTELWDATFGINGHAGYQQVGIASGVSKNYVNTLAGAPDEHVFGVITMTGVHQTTPVGTHQAQIIEDATSSSLTVAGVVTDGLVVDNLYVWNLTEVIGADQTVRNTEDVGPFTFAQSTQPGSAGGVMSWTFGIADNTLHGAVEFKPAAAGVLLAIAVGAMSLAGQAPTASVVAPPAPNTAHIIIAPS